MFENALVPLRFDEPPELVQSLTTFLKNFETRSIVLVHVVSSGLESVSGSERRLRKLSRQLAADGYDIETVVRTGSPALEICAVADQRELSFICIPWRTKSFLQRTLLGNTTVDVARLTNVPLFVYKPHGRKTETTRLQSVLYAASLEGGHEQVIPYLRDEHLAATHLYLLHVGWRAPDPWAELSRREEIFHQLSAIKNECEGCYETIQTISVVGNARRHILREAREREVELIVLGKHEHDREQALETMLGSTAERITHEAKVSVLLIPSRRTKLQTEAPWTG